MCVSMSITLVKQSETKWSVFSLFLICVYCYTNLSFPFNHSYLKTDNSRWDFSFLFFLPLVLLCHSTFYPLDRILYHQLFFDSIHILLEQFVSRLKRECSLFVNLLAMYVRILSSTIVYTIKTLPTRRTNSFVWAKVYQIERVIVNK